MITLGALNEVGYLFNEFIILGEGQEVLVYNISVMISVEILYYYIRAH